MLRKFTLLFFVSVLGSLLAAAQDMSKFDLFGGYSYFNGSTSGATSRYSLNGWNGQGTVYLNHWLGATADFGGYYGSPFGLSANNYSFLFGPTVRVPMTRVSPFAHVLFGADRAQESLLGGSTTDTSFGMALGGGVDIPVKGVLAIRAGQVDWLYTNHFSTGQNNVRVSTGVVFRFGQ